jgi:hypothetical protein
MKPKILRHYFYLEPAYAHTLAASELSISWRLARYFKVPAAYRKLLRERMRYHALLAVEKDRIEARERMARAA